MRFCVRWSFWPRSVSALSLSQEFVKETTKNPPQNGQPKLEAVGPTMPTSSTAFAEAESH